MRTLILIAMASLFVPMEASPQTALEQRIIDAIGSPSAVELATDHMDASETAARSVSSDPAVPGPGMLDVDPLSGEGEWYVNYETSDDEMCRAVTATAAAAVLADNSSGEWLISTSCRAGAVELTLDLDANTAQGKQWRGPDGYLWENSWRF